MKTQFKSETDARTARVAAHPFKESAYCVLYTFPSGREAMRGPFPSKRAAADWARGYVRDPANA